ncbi:MICOS complex subunit MIC10 isoform X1 [Daphnia magna]|uniref:MICOS complex subunit MIC10 n=1 Tax=Daphnia magna TaxID=35525 RepID=A0A164M2A5_9CRUS|nr:MICOS complex subunit MIC10 isoform X1 [Daphnia magna]KZS04657.1 MICOS complex subunit MIC10 [Daphnia magna]
MGSSKNSEDVLANTVDSCVADALIKLGGGLITGTLFSLLLFKRKSWPAVFGVGVGAGMGMSNCHYKLNMPYLVGADMIKVENQAFRRNNVNQIGKDSS